MKNKHVKEPIVCEFCNEAFTNNSAMKRHESSRHYYKHCDGNLRDFDMHMQDHLKCSVCGKEVDKMWKINKHIKSH